MFKKDIFDIYEHLKLDKTKCVSKIFKNSVITNIKYNYSKNFPKTILIIMLSVVLHKKTKNENF